MKQINKRLLMSALALLLVCGVSLSGVAAAEDGSGGSGDATTSSTSSTSSTESNDSTTTESPEVETHAHLLMQQFKQQGQQNLQEKIKTQVHQHTAQERQKACEARKASLTTRMSNAVAAAQRHKQVFDSIYVKVKDFYASKNLNVSNYASLTAAVDTAQSDAAAKVAALKSLDISVDCTQAGSLASNISAFKAAESSTRDSLKSYRKALVELITALHGASTGAQTDSSTNSSSND